MAPPGLNPRDTLGNGLLVSSSQDVHRIRLLDPSSSSGREDAPGPGSRKGWDDRPWCRREPDGELREASDEAGCDAGVCPRWAYVALFSRNHSTVARTASGSGDAFQPKARSNLLLSTTHERSDW